MLVSTEFDGVLKAAIEDARVAAKYFKSLIEEEVPESSAISLTSSYISMRRFERKTMDTTGAVGGITQDPPSGG